MPNPRPQAPDAGAPLTAEEVAARQGVDPLSSVADAQVDLWEDDAEVDAFIVDVRRARRTNSA